MLGGEIKVKLSLDNDQFVIQTQKAGMTIQELQRVIDRTSRSTEALEHHFTGAMGKFRSVIQTASMLRYAIHDVHDVFMALPGAILKSSGDMEKMTKLMEGMSKETTKAARNAEALSNVKFVFDMAQRAPFDVKTLTDAMVKFKSAGLDPTDGSMKALVDSVARFGGTSDAMHRASIAIQQMAGKGVISMEELRQQLGEAVPNAINMMAQGAGMSMQKFTKLVSTGTVEASTALRNMFLVMRFENDGAAEAMMDSWTGMLSLLSTKFELFKIEAGKNDFFKEAKNQLADLIGAFDTGGAKGLASSIGSGLADLVRTLRDLINLMTQWSDTIAFAGKAFLTYFAATKVASFGKAMKDAIDGQVKKYKELNQAKQDDLDKAKKLVDDEIANRERQLKAEQGLIDKQVSAEQKAATKKLQIAEQQRIKNAAELSDLDTKYRNALRMQQEFLGKQMAAELAAEAALRQRKAGSSATAKGYMEEAGRIGNNAAVVTAKVNEYKAEILAIKDRDAALLQSMHTTRLATTANYHQAESAVVLAQHARTMRDLLERQRGAADSAAAGIGALARAGSGLKIVFEAMGGWVGIAIAVLATLGQKLWEYMDRWNEFDKVVKRTEAGIGSKDDLKKTNAATAEAAGNVENLQKALAKLDKYNQSNPSYARSLAKSQGFIDPKTTMGDFAAYRASIEKSLKEQQAIYATATASQGEQTKLLGEERVRVEVSQFERTYRRGTEAKVDALRAENAELAKAEADERKKAQGKGATQSALDEISKGYTDKKNANVKAREQFLLDYASKKKEELQAILNIEKNADKKIALGKQMAFVNEQIEQAATALNQSDSLGKLSTAKKDPKGNAKEAPIVRMAEEAKASVAIAALKYKEALEGVKDLEGSRRQIALKLFGDVAKGSFDTKGEDADGKKTSVRFGGMGNRKEWVAQFQKQVIEGGKSIEEFIQSLNLAETDAKRLMDIINDQTKAKNFTEYATGFQRASNLAADAARDLEASMQEMATDGASKDERALNALRGQFDELAKSMRLAGDDLDKFNAVRDKALGDAAAATSNRSFITQREDNRKFVEDVTKGIQQSSIARQRATMDYRELAKATYEEELREFTEKEIKQRRENAARVKEDGSNYAQYVEEVKRLDEASLRFRAEAMNRYAENAKSALDKIAEDWSNSVNAMNQATGNWATDFMDRFTDMIAGGAFKWQEFVSGMAKDLLKISLKQNFGNMVTSMFGSFGAKAGEMLGIGKSATDATQAATISTAMTTMTGATTAAMTTHTTTITTAMTTATTAITTAMTAITTAVTAAMTQLGLSSGASGDGGIGGLIGGLIGSGAGGAGAAAGGSTIMAGDFAMVAANGGLMTEFGPASLKKYAMGGIANSPQVSLFGEGSTPEAYVPLPDGRSIPVTMSGGNTTTTTSNGVIINIVVNKDGSQSTSATGDDGKAWQTMAQKVRGVVMDEMVNQQRPGGLLYNR